MPIDQDRLDANHSLAKQQSLTSANGAFVLAFQEDSNLVLYKNYRSRDRRRLWSSGTSRRIGEVCVMQGDGNLVIYGPDNEYIWDTATNGNPDSFLAVQDDGNLVIYRPDGSPAWSSNTVQPLPLTGLSAQGDDIQPGELLTPNQPITSPNGRYTLVLRKDGNLVLHKNYRNGSRKALWRSVPNGLPGEVCIMQGDGNLVIYGPDNEYIWDTETNGNPDSFLVVQDDGNLVIYRPDGSPIWSSNTVQPLPLTGPSAQGDDIQPGELLTPDQSITSPNGRYTLVLQTDGNLVLYRNTDGVPLWASGTDGRLSDVCILQGDGNLVIYGPDNEYIWDTGTNGNPGSRLLVQDDGNVIILDAVTQQIWATATLPPAVNALIPISGQVGDSITVTGDHFLGTQRVLIGSIIATFRATSQRSITATVPDFAVSGFVTVVTRIGSATSANQFTVVPTPRPSIDGFSPASGLPGTGIAITGSGLGRASAVQFNGANAQFRPLSDSRILATVPANATDGPISVTTRGGIASSANPFDVEVIELPANLAFLNSWIEPSVYPRPNSPFVVYFSFINGGGRVSGDFSIRLELDNGAMQIEISVPSRDVGTVDSVYWNFPRGLSAGDHFIYAYLDVLGEVAEVSEADNVSYLGFRVQ